METRAVCGILNSSCGFAYLIGGVTHLFQIHVLCFVVEIILFILKNILILNLYLIYIHTLTPSLYVWLPLRCSMNKQVISSCLYRASTVLTHSLPQSTLVDLTFQSRALRSFSLNPLRNLSLQAGNLHSSFSISS